MPGRYERDHDSAADTSRTTHETFGKLRSLLDELTTQLDRLEKQVNPTEKGGNGDTAR